MDLKNGSIALFVRDIEVSKSFYRDIMGFTIKLDFGKNVIFKEGFAIWEIQESHIITEKIGSSVIRNTSANHFELYFETEDLLEVFLQLTKYPVRFLHEIHEEPWGQQTIRFFDPDNHLIEIGESMELFVGRFYAQGLTIDDISRRTHVPPAEVKRLLGTI